MMYREIIAVLFWNPYKIHKYVLCLQRRIFLNFKIVGTYNRHWAFKESKRVTAFADYECSHVAGRSWWPRCLRRESEAAHALGLRVRIPPGDWCLSVVSVVCCQVELSATGWSLVQRSPTECSVGLSECDNEGDPGPLVPVVPWKKNHCRSWNWSAI